MTDEPRPEGTAGAEPPGVAEQAAIGFAMPDPVRHQRASASGFLLDAIRHRRAGRRVLSGVITMLFLAGAGMFTYPFFTDLYTKHSVQAGLEQEFEHDSLRALTFEEWEATVENGRALTRIIIPELGVNTLVVEGTSPDALRAGAGHYPNTPLPGQDGNVAIAGHRTTYGRPFNQVDLLEAGDAIWLLTPVGEYEYEVVTPPAEWGATPEAYRCETACFITHPQDWQVIAPTSVPSLTLTSCHPKGSAAQRIVIRAELRKAHQPGTYGNTSA